MVPRDEYFSDSTMYTLTKEITQFCVQFVHPTKEWSEGNPIIHTDDVSLHACFTAYSGTALD